MINKEFNMALYLQPVSRMEQENIKWQWKREEKKALAERKLVEAKKKVTSE